MKGGVMVSHALDEWEVDRKAEIRLARELAGKSPSELPAQSAANILLASYIRVCVAEFQAFCAALTAKRWSPFGRFSTAR